MTRLPTERAARDLCDSLRALSRRPRATTLAKLDPTLIDSIERRLTAAIRRDGAYPTAPDGYPIRTGGGPAGNGHGSSTETAAVALADGDTPPDRHHDLTARAAQAVEDAVINLNTLITALSAIDGLVTPSDPAPNTCDHCTGKRGPDADRAVHATGTVGDRIERALALCRHCYGFVEQTARPGTRLGYLPADDQIRHHEDTGRWRIRIAQ